MNEEFLNYLEKNKEQISLDEFIQSVEATEKLCESKFFSQNIMRLNHYIYCWIFDQELQNYFYQMCYNSFLNNDYNSLSRVFNVVIINYGPDFLHQNLMKKLYEIYNKDNEFIDFICDFDFQLRQDKIIRDYILDADNNNLPEELEDKFIEKCLDDKNFDALNKYFSRDKQSNIDKVIKILNSGHEKAFTYVKDQRNLHDIISDICKRFDDIEDKDAKCKVIEYFVQIKNEQIEKNEERYQDLLSKYSEILKLNRVLRMSLERQCEIDCVIKERVQDLDEEVINLKKVNLGLLEKNNKLLQQKEEYAKKNDKLHQLYRNSIESLSQTQRDLANSDKRNQELLRLGFNMGNFFGSMAGVAPPNSVSNAAAESAQGSKGQENASATK